MCVCVCVRVCVHSACVIMKICYTALVFLLIFLKLNYFYLEIHEDCYRMDTDPRGLCLIVNNVNFSNNLSTRSGSDVDADKLAELFQSFLLFHVRQERDVTINQLLRILEDLQKENHSKYCVFAMVILSHGDEGGVVYCSDGVSITIEQYQIISRQTIVRHCVINLSFFLCKHAEERK